MACCTFAAPLVGNEELGATVADMGKQNHFLHIVRRHDIVPRLLLSPSSALTSEQLELFEVDARLHSHRTNRPYADSLCQD